MKRFLLATAALSAAAGGTAPAGADTLREALIATYQSNPTLNGQRQSLEATDATVAIARAAARPRIAASVGANPGLTRSGILNTGRSKGPTISGGIDLDLLLFSGGRVRNKLRQPGPASKPAAPRSGRSRGTSLPMRSPPTWTFCAIARSLLSVKIRHGY